MVAGELNAPPSSLNTAALLCGMSPGIRDVLRSETPRAESAVSECGECVADPAARIVQTSDASCEHRDGLGAEVVERCGALDVETFIRAERDLGGDRPNGAGDRSDDDPVEVCGGEVATDDQHRPTLVLGFGPPDVTLTGPRVHHGSSAIIARAFASAAASSSTVSGVRW